MIVIAFVLACLLAIRIVPMGLTASVATAFGVFIIWRCRVLGRQLLTQRSVNLVAVPWDTRPTRRQRRIASRALAWSLRRTEFSSLLPQIAVRAERMFMALEAWHLMKRADRRQAIVR